MVANMYFWLEPRTERWEGEKTKLNLGKGGILGETLKCSGSSDSYAASLQVWRQQLLPIAFWWPSLPD